MSQTGFAAVFCTGEDGYGLIGTILHQYFFFDTPTANQGYLSHFFPLQVSLLPQFSTII
jgi:hypothetical protein